MNDKQVTVGAGIPKAMAEAILKAQTDMPSLKKEDRNAFAKYNVVAFFADVHPWESYVDLWSNKFRERVMVKASSGHHIGYNMSGNQQEITEANQRLVSGIADGTFTHNGNKVLRRHVMNTRKRFNTWGMTFTKDGRENDKYNDAYAATLLAFIALSKYLESGKRPKPKHNGKVHMFR